MNLVYVEPPENIVVEAYKFAEKAHTGQRRDSGEEFFEHPKTVYNILRLVTDDEAILAAALLHDTMEDTDVTREDIVDRFGGVIAWYVDCLTKEDGKLPMLKTNKEAILIKFADRLHNLSTSYVWNRRKEYEYILSSKFWKE